ncbi:MAG TPA: DUF3368 domain-containing protein [Mucilaginibacter sp.]
MNKLFGIIVTTSYVAAEFALTLPSWFEIIDPQNKKYQSIIESSVDKGEASAIALAIEFDESLLIIDDLKGRRFAQNLGLNITGTIGIIVEAKLLGFIPSVGEIITKIRETDFRISEKIELIALKKAGEL